MKKIVKSLLAVGAVAGSIAGILYFLNKKKEEDDFEDFDDEEFEDVFDDEEDGDNRDYVTLDLEKEPEKDESEEGEPEQ